MMKKFYEEPALEMIRLETEETITTDVNNTLSSIGMMADASVEEW